MKYTIKYNLFKTKATLYNAYNEPIATGSSIARLAPDVTKQALFIVSDKKSGTYSVFNARQKDYIATGLESACDTLVSNGMPMLYKKDGKTLYVDPINAVVVDIPKTDTICFEQDYNGRPTFNTVFVVHNGMPTPLVIGDQSNIYHNVARFPQQDSVSNVYRPLLLRYNDDLINFLGGTNARAYRELAEEYAALEGKDRLAEFLPAVKNHMYNIVTVDGRYGKKYLQEQRDYELKRMLTSEKERKAVASKTKSNGARISEINGQLMALGQPSYTETDIRYFRDDYKKPALKALKKAMENATPEVAKLYEERAALISEELRVIGSAESIAQQEDLAAHDVYLYNLRIKEETIDLIEQVGDLFTTIQGEYGIKQPENMKPAEGKVIDAEETEGLRQAPPPPKPISAEEDKKPAPKKSHELEQ